MGMPLQTHNQKQCNGGLPIHKEKPVEAKMASLNINVSSIHHVVIMTHHVSLVIHGVTTVVVLKHLLQAVMQAVMLNVMPLTFSRDNTVSITATNSEKY